MALKVPNVGVISQLDLLSALMDASWVMHLFQNDYTPVAGTVIGDFTEATFSGYAGGITLTNPSAAAMVGARASTTFDDNLWSHSGGATSNLIYGYYVVDGGGGLQFAQRDSSGPRSMAALGDTYRVTPVYTLRSEF